jgi:peroxiredoxin
VEPIVRKVLRASLSLAMALVAGAVCAETAHTPKQGAEPQGPVAPAVILRTLDGKTIDLAKLYGKKAVYLKFWATWCVDCREQMPHFQGVYKQEDDSLAVVGINLGLNDAPSDVKQFAVAHGLTMPLAVDDGSAAVSFEVNATPTHIVIGKDGRIVHVGHRADAKLANALQLARSIDVKARTSHPPSLSKSIAVGGRITLSSVFAGAKVVHRGQASASVLRQMDSGKPTILVFFAAWCESYLEKTRAADATQCRLVREELARQWKQNGDRVNTLWIASNLWTNPGALNQFALKHQIESPMLLDRRGELFRQFGIQLVPTVVVVDTHGAVREIIAGDAQRVGIVLDEY